MTPINKDELFKLFFNRLCRHFVVMTGTYFQLDDSGKPTSDELLFTYSGFAMSFGSAWFLVTAGHVIKEINEYIHHKNIRIKEFNLLDWTGTDAKHKTLIPFNFEGSCPYGLSDEQLGVDFGYLALSEHDKRLLQSNGIIAFEEKDWIKQPKSEDFIAHCVLGVPQESVTKKLGISITGVPSIGTLETRLLWLRKTEVASDRKPTQLPRFVAEITSLGDLQSIVGMSGGPVFGLAVEKQSGRLKYWPVAIQSAWDEKTKTVFACPLAPCAFMLHAVLNAEAEGDSSETQE